MRGKQENFSSRLCGRFPETQRFGQPLATRYATPPTRRARRRRIATRWRSTRTTSVHSPASMPLAREPDGAGRTVEPMNARGMAEPADAETSGRAVIVGQGYVGLPLAVAAAM